MRALVVDADQIFRSMLSASLRRRHVEPGEPDHAAALGRKGAPIDVDIVDAALFGGNPIEHASGPAAREDAPCLIVSVTAVGGKGVIGALVARALKADGVLVKPSCCATPYDGEA